MAKQQAGDSKEPTQAELDEKARFEAEQAAKLAEATDPERLAEEEARQKAQADALAAAQAAAQASQDLLAKLMADQQAMQQKMAQLESEIAKQQKAAGKVVTREPRKLVGPANLETEKAHMAAIWPKNEKRKPVAPRVKTFMVEPVGAAVNEGWEPAIVSNCYDEADAKAAFMKMYKLELHGLPVRIYEVNQDTAA